MHSDGHLSVRARAALKRDPTSRNIADMMQLRELVQRLSCFKRYSHVPPESLARILHYEHVTSGQIIVRQGAYTSDSANIRSYVTTFCRKASIHGMRSGSSANL